MDKLPELENLADKVKNCRICSLGKSCRNPVFGEGNPRSSIMLIGEGPGAEEDKLGRPFVGRAGQLLDKILEASGFGRFTHVYITNIVKCRPPQNRIPTPQERLACLPYLREQIGIIEPRIIILLGATALQGLIDPAARISQQRGNWLRWQDMWVMPVYHPAALLRNPALKKATWEDFQAIVKKYRELVDPDHKSPYC
jgi:uracil-DNA glycosylase family 4